MNQIQMNFKSALLQFVAALLILVYPTTVSCSILSDMPARSTHQARPSVSEVADYFKQALDPDIALDDTTEDSSPEEMVVEAEQPSVDTITASLQPLEMEEVTSLSPEGEMQMGVSSEEMDAEQQAQQTTPAQPTVDQRIQELQENLKRLQQEKEREEAAKADELRKQEALRQEQQRQRDLEEAKKAAEKKAAETVQRQLDTMPRLFGQLPVGETTQEEVNGVTIETQTSYGKFEIFAKKNGESTLPRAIMELGIQQAAHGPRASEFTRRYKAAKTRLEQETVLKEFDPDVARYRAPDQLVDPEKVTCSDHARPDYFPKEPYDPVRNPGGYHIIRHFGENPDTRMGSQVNTFDDFVAAAPKALDAIRTRLPGFITDFRVRAELADIIYEMIRTKKIDSRVAREDWTRNHQARDWSTGSRNPMRWVWFEPDEIGMQERGLMIISRISGEAFWLNYRCGINIDKLAGCEAPVFVGNFKVTVEENYQICDRLEVPGRQVIGKDSRGNNIYGLNSGETVTAVVTPRSTGPTVRGTPGWFWEVNNSSYDHEGIDRVPVNESMLVNHFLTLSVSSTLPKNEQTQPNERKYCAISFASSPHALCESLGQMEIRGDRVFVPFRYEDDSHVVKEVVYLLDHQPIAPDLIRAEAVGISFPLSLIKSAGDHYVNVQLLGSDRQVVAECSGETTNKIHIAEAECVSSSVVLHEEKNHYFGTFAVTDTLSLVKRYELLLDGVVQKGASITRTPEGIAYDLRKEVGFGDHKITIRGYNERGALVWECGTQFTKPQPCKCSSAQPDRGHLKKTDLDEVITIVPQLTGDRSQIASAVWTDYRGNEVNPALIGSNFELSFKAGEILPLVAGKHGPILKDGKYAFTLTVTSVNGEVSRCKVILKIGGSRWWIWVIVAVIVAGAIIAAILLTGGAAIPVVTKIPVPVIGV